MFLNAVISPSFRPDNCGFTLETDLVISISDNPDPVLVGQLLTYTITVENKAKVAAESTEIQFTFSNTLTYVQTIAPIPGVCNRVGTTVTCNIGTLAGETSYEFNVETRTTVVGTPIANAEVSTTTPETCESGANNAVTEPSIVVSESWTGRLTKILVPARAIVSPGESVEFLVEIENQGAQSVAEVVITDFPNNVDIISGAPSIGTFTVSPPKWTIPVLEAGATASMTLNSKVKTNLASGTVVGNKVCVSAKDKGNTLPSCVNAIDVVIGELQTTKTSNVAVAKAGDTITYTVVVVNTGAAAHTNVAVTDTLPAGLTYVGPVSGSLKQFSTITYTEQFNDPGTGADEINYTSGNWPNPFTENPTSKGWDEDDVLISSRFSNYHVEIENEFEGFETNLDLRHPTPDTYTAATLTFQYRRDETTFPVTVEVFNGAWVVVGTIGPTPTASDAGFISFTANLASLIGANGKVAIKSGKKVTGGDKGHFYIDNFIATITRQETLPAPGLTNNPASFISGLTMTAGAELTLTYTASINDPVTASPIKNVVNAVSATQTDPSKVSAVVIATHATDDAYTVTGTQTLPVTSNDFDKNDLNKALTIVTPPTKGSFTVDATTGSIIYTPNEGETGVDTIVYRICSTSEPSVCDTATVTITIATEPEIVVLGNSVSITAGDTSPSFVDHTNFGEVTKLDGVGDRVVRTFQITNIGISPLTISALTSSNTLFAINTPLGAPVNLSPIAAGETASFEVELNVLPATATGNQISDITITNNDADEGSFVFRVSGTVIADDHPDISVLGNGKQIPDSDVDASFVPNTDDHTKFEDTIVASCSTRTYTILNEGNVDLQITGPIVTASTDFKVVQQPTGEAIPPGLTASFIVEFCPTTPGNKQATLSIPTNEPGAPENIFQFPVQGTGVAAGNPEIVVEGNSKEITSGDATPSLLDHTNFGEVLTSTGSVARTFTIKNIGTTALNANAVNIVGSADFSVTSPPTSPVAAGGSTTFTVTFDPSANTFIQATVSIVNSDADENPFTFAILGNGLAAGPNIIVEGNGLLIGNGDNTPIAADNTDFGSIINGASETLKSFTIRNIGDASATISAILVTGTHVAGSEGFRRASAFSAQSLAAGATLSFNIGFTPGTSASQQGLRHATIAVDSDDPNDDPYMFSVVANTIGPEIQVSGNNKNILDGDTSPSFEDHTNFGEVTVTAAAGDHVVRTFTVKNSGASDLSITSIVSSNAAFTIVPSVPGTLKPGELGIFDVLVKRNTPGVQTATITINNNDPDEASFDFLVAIDVEAASEPDIEVSGNSIVIPAGLVNTPAISDNTDFGNVAVSTSPTAKTLSFTILNRGDADLVLVSPNSISLGTGTHFTVVTQPAVTTLSPGISTSFQIRFDPSAAGSHDDQISIDQVNANADPDEDPYEFKITGTGIATAPEIDVYGKSVLINNNDFTPILDDNTLFGSQTVSGGTITKQFAITNSGEQSLSIPGGVTLQGVNSADFTVVTQPPTSILPGQTATFEVRFDPSGSGTRNAMVVINNNDPNESVYQFNIEAYGIADNTPDIQITGNSIEIEHADTSPSVLDDTNFGTSIAAGTIDKQFVISNTGNTNTLTLANGPNFVEIEGAHASEFTVTSQPGSSTLAPGASTTFTVRFTAGTTPDKLGIRSAIIKVNSDDPDENPFLYSVLAKAVTSSVPDIAVLGLGNNILDGATSLSVNDNTQFGKVTVEAGAGDHVVHTFVVKNVGSADLILSSTPRIVLSGAVEFTVKSFPGATLKPGETNSFEILLKGNIAGVVTATVEILSNDPDETLFDFRVGGEVIANKPNVDIFGNNLLIPNGDTTPQRADNTDMGLVADGSSVQQIFTIKNNGAKDLSILDVVSSSSSDFIISVQPSVNLIPAGSSTTFVVKFLNPATLPKVKTATITVRTSDASDNPYTFEVKATRVLAADKELEVFGNFKLISSGDTTPSSDDFTNMGDTNQGAIVKQFAIKNRGGSDLSVTAISFTGDHATEFSTPFSGPVTIPAGNSQNFDVSFNGVVSGLREATVSIASDGATNPYTFDIVATRLVAGPDIDVLGNLIEILNGDSTPIVADNTDFGEVIVGASSVAKQFTIKNNGASVLTINSVSITGTHTSASSHFTTPVLATTVAAGGSTDFTVTFTPGAAANEQGLRHATISIDSDDSVDNPYMYSITALVVGPEIQVFGNSNAIEDGQVALSFTDNTNFGEISQNAGAGDHVVKLFSVENVGKSPLDVNSISSSNTNQFVIKSNSFTSLNPGEVGTFEVEFKDVIASGPGSYSAVITINNDDADEGAPSHFTFAVGGVVVAATFADIDVLGNSISIANGDNSPEYADNTRLGNVAVNGNIKKQFKIVNNGNSDLIISNAINVGGTSEFTITQQPSGEPIAPGQETTFEVSYIPTNSGTDIGVVTIQSNDPNENPFTFTVQGTGISGREMDVEGNGLVIENNDFTPSINDHTDFGEVLASAGTIVRTFTIQNRGDASLTLTGTPTVSVIGINPGQFVVTQPGSTTIAAGASQSFTVTFDPLSTGTKVAQIVIPSDDANENPYVFVIKGEGLPDDKDIKVTGNSIEIANGDTTPTPTDFTDFGQITFNTANKDNTFTVSNIGSTALTLTTVTIDGTHKEAAGEGFSILSFTAGTIAAGASSNFVVRFKPGSAAAQQGKRHAIVVIDTDDPNEDPYMFSIVATTVGPEIRVLGNDVDISDGDTSPSTLDFTYFGQITTTPGAGDRLVRTFNIQNTGVIPLTITSIALSGFAGTIFNLQSTASTPIHPGEFASFEIEFKHNAAGSFTGLVTIENNDADEDPFTFTIGGEAIAAQPDIDVLGNLLSISDGDTTPSTLDNTHFGNNLDTSGNGILHTFTIQNRGTANLVLSGISISSGSSDFSIVSQPATNSLAPGLSTTFSVLFDATDASDEVATIQILNNDPTEGVYTFNVAGRGISASLPQIEVTGNNHIINSGDITPRYEDFTFLGRTVITRTTSRQFVINNIGTVDLVLGGTPIVVIEGIHSSEFTITTPPTTPITSGGSSSFTVTFTPTVVGIRTALVRITNNANGQYTFVVSGWASAAGNPQIEVEGNTVLISPGDTSPTPVDHTDFGRGLPGTNIAREYTIRNIGATVLNLNTVTSGGTHPSVGVADEGFYIKSQPATTALAPGGTTTFTVEFVPESALSSLGFRHATISIPSDDPDDDPFVFSVLAFTVGPEIEVLGNDVQIINKDTTPAFEDFTDFGVVSAVAGAGDRVVRTFVVRNTGEAPLTITNIESNNAEFVISSPTMPQVLQSDEVLLFEVAFKSASGAANRQAVIKITNDDPDEGIGPDEFFFNVKGDSINSPAISVFGNSNHIVDGDTTPSILDHTTMINSFAGGPSTFRKFEIYNPGTTALTLGALTSTVTTEIIISQQPQLSVLPAGASTEFEVEFKPVLPGSKSAIISIPTNAPGSFATYTFVVEAFAAAVTSPEIDVEGNGLLIVNTDSTPRSDDNTYVGATLPGTPVTRSFTILNRGGVDLTLTGTPAVTIIGTNSGDFSVTVQPTSPIASAGSQTLTIAFNPVAGVAMMREAVVQIPNNDPDESPYYFTIQGYRSGPAANLEVSGGAGDLLIVNGDFIPRLLDNTDFGKVPATSSVTKTFKVWNRGTAALTITSITTIGTHSGAAVDFTVTPAVASPPAIASGAFLSFTVEFKAGALASQQGIRNSLIQIISSDPNEDPYLYSITANTIGPEIEVFGNDENIADGSTSTKISDNTLYGHVTITPGAGDHRVNSFQVVNVGTEPLTITSITSSNLNQFRILSNTMFSPLQPGEYGTIEISFQDFASDGDGSYTSTIEILNNDADEATFTFNVAGTIRVATTPAAKQPIIVVTGNAIEIANNDLTPSFKDNTNFGDTYTGGVVSRIFTIYNRGDTLLDIQSISSNTAEYFISLPVSLPIAPGHSRQFEVTFKPTSTGNKPGEISIVNNDPTSSPYKFGITGTSVAANSAIAVFGNNIFIENNDITPRVDDFTQFGQLLVSAGTIAKTFTITNIGQATLTLTSASPVTTTGSNAAEFVVTQPAVTSLATGVSTTFTITFDPASFGTRRSTVTIASDDPDDNPYSFTIEGVGLPAGPDISVLGNAIEIINGDVSPNIADNTDFGDVKFDTPVVKAFSIKNNGDAVLNIASMTTTGSHINPGEGFSISTSFTGNIASGATGAFEITFTPGTAANEQGYRHATVFIRSDDPNEDPYMFSVIANTLGPEIRVLGNQQDLTNGQTAVTFSDHTNFGDIHTTAGPGSVVVRTFQIINDGVADLNVGAITSNNAAFTIPHNAVGTLVSGESGLFEVRFSSATAAAAVITIVNNDVDENPFTFTVSGTVRTAAESDLQVWGNNLYIPPGDTSSRIEDNTHFGKARVTGGTIIKQFVLRNRGTNNLNINAITSTNGVFVPGAASRSVIPPSESATFSVTFDPATTGTASATIRVASDDPVPSPYEFLVTGVGSPDGAPDIQVEGNGNWIANGKTSTSVDDNTFFGDVGVGDTAAKSFTIRNTGGGVLNLVGTPIVKVLGAHKADFAITTQPGTNTVAASATTTYTVTFTAGALGKRTAVIYIENNDAEDANYLYTVEATSVSKTQPDLDVAGNGIEIELADNTPRLADNTYFGTHPLSSTVDKAFTITASAWANVVLDATTPIEVLGTHAKTGATGFSLQPGVAAGQTINAGTSITFTIRHEAGSTLAESGPRLATIKIKSNDPDEDPYFFSIAIYVSSEADPEIEVLGNSVQITDGASTPNFADHTQFGSVANAIGPNDRVVRTFQIKNVGVGPLTITLPSTTAPNAYFTIANQPDASVVPNGITTFEIVFKAIGATPGNVQSTVTITNNDPDEGTFTFVIGGTIEANGQVMLVKGNNVEISHTGTNTPALADNTHFGNVAVGTSVTKTFEILNVGDADLQLDGTPIVDVTAAGLFTISTQPTVTTVQSGVVTTFQVTFTPTAAGAVTRTITIENTDASKDPYNFVVGGTGISGAAKIDVLGNSIIIANGDTTPQPLDNTHFGDLLVGSPVTKTFVIKNNGDSPLTLTNSPRVLTTTGNAAEFVVSTQPTSSTVAANGQESFIITWTPAAAGTRITTVSIPNSDTSFSFAIEGKAISAASPEISISGNGLEIPSGTTATSSATGTFFGNIKQLSGVTLAKTFKITNQGGAALSFTGAKIEVVGAHKNSGTEGFSVAVFSETSLNSQNELDFTVTYTVGTSATHLGSRHATVKVYSSDADEPVYSFSIAAFVVAVPPGSETFELLSPSIDALWYMYYPHVTTWTHNFAEAHNLELALYTESGVKINLYKYSGAAKPANQNHNYVWRPHKCMPGKYYVIPTTSGPTHNGPWPKSPIFRIGIRGMVRCTSVEWC